MSTSIIYLATNQVPVTCTEPSSGPLKPVARLYAFHVFASPRSGELQCPHSPRFQTYFRTHTQPQTSRSFHLFFLSSAYDRSLFPLSLSSLCFLSLVQACPGPVVTLLAVTAALDKNTVVRLEAWLEQQSLEPEAQALVSSTQAACTGTTEPPTAMTSATDNCAVAAKAAESAARSAKGHEETEAQAPPSTATHAHATRIQAQVLLRAHGLLQHHGHCSQDFVQSKILWRTKYSNSL